MKNKAVYNLGSPNRLRHACDPKNLDLWFDSELAAVDSPPIRDVLKSVVQHLENFICWPRRPILLWRGCDRVPPLGKKNKYFSYPDPIKQLANRKVTLDTRQNGPAIASFLIAGGERPARFGSSNAWSIHHLYSGKFPYMDKPTSTHAIKSGLHFTQSAGLVATHPIADAICDEFPFFAWRLRIEAFSRFGYDPDKIFGEGHDQFGFVGGKMCEVVFDGVSTEGS